MPDNTTETPKYRKLRIEIPEEVAARLDASAEKYSRYLNASDVAAECVRLYHDLLERADSETQEFKEQQKREVLASTR